jgi:LacI family transcriptional regulator
LRKERFPFVTFGRTRHPSEFVRVDADAAGAAALATEHLFALGHRRIALVLPVLDGEPVLGNHFHALVGFKHAHRAYGLPLQRAQIVKYNITEGMGESIAPIVTGALDVSAVIAAGNDLEAVTILRVLSERGRRVPDDISLVGLVDSPLTQMAQPSITVTDLPVTEMCNLAVDLLIDLIKGRKPRQLEHLLPVTLLVRPSTRRIGPALLPLAPALAASEGT